MPVDDQPKIPLRGIVFGGIYVGAVTMATGDPSPDPRAYPLTCRLGPAKNDQRCRESRADRMDDSDDMQDLADFDASEFDVDAGAPPPQPPAPLPLNVL